MKIEGSILNPYMDIKTDFDEAAQKALKNSTALIHMPRIVFSGIEIVTLTFVVSLKLYLLCI